MIHSIMGCVGSCSMKGSSFHSYFSSQHSLGPLLEYPMHEGLFLILQKGNKKVEHVRSSLLVHLGKSLAPLLESQSYQ